MGGDSSAALISGLLEGVGTGLLERRKEGIERDQKKYAFAQKALALLDNDPNATPDLKAWAIKGMLVPPPNPAEGLIHKGIRKIRGKEAPPPPNAQLHGILDKIAHMPVTGQPGVMSMQMPGGPPPQRGQAQQAQGPMDLGSPGGQPVSTVPGRPQELPVETPGRGQAIPHRMSEAEQPFAQGPGEQRQPGMFYSPEESAQQAASASGMRIGSDERARLAAEIDAITQNITDPEQRQQAIQEKLTGWRGRTSEFKPVTGTMPDGTKKSAFLDSALGAYVDADTHQPLKGFVPDAKSISSHEDDMQRFLDIKEAERGRKSTAKEQEQDVKEYKQSGQQPVAVYIQKALAAEDIHIDAEKKKEVLKDIEGYNRDRQTHLLMEKELPRALAGNQQAMVMLTAYHVLMTLRLPGSVSNVSRVNQVQFEEAEKSSPLLQRIQARFDDRGYLSGIVITPDQAKQMVELGADKEQASYDGIVGHAGDLGLDVKKLAPGLKAPSTVPKRDINNQASNMVHMKAPDGSDADVPEDQVKAAEAAGAVRVQ